ncbi:unnamed protein product, partial [Allacma fusca]
LPNELMSTSLGIATSGTSAGYSGPPESIQTYCQLWDKPVCPSEIKTPKQTLRDHLNRDQSRIDPVSLSLSLKQRKSRTPLKILIPHAEPQLNA